MAKKSDNENMFRPRSICFHVGDRVDPRISKYKAVRMKFNSPHLASNTAILRIHMKRDSYKETERGRERERAGERKRETDRQINRRQKRE